MNSEMTNTEYRRMNDLPEAGSLPETMDWIGNREPVEVISTSVFIPGIPAYLLSPNSRSHWRRKHAESQELKQRTMTACRLAHHVSGPVVIAWTIYLAKHGKKRDIDNLLPCLKPAQDAFVDRGYIDGDGPKVVVSVSVQQIVWSDYVFGHVWEPGMQAVITSAAITGEGM